MSIASVATAIVAGQQGEIRTGIAMAVARHQVKASRDFVAQVAQIAKELQAAAPQGMGRVVDRRA